MTTPEVQKFYLHMEHIEQVSQEINNTNILAVYFSDDLEGCIYAKGQ